MKISFGELVSTLSVDPFFGIDELQMDTLTDKNQHGKTTKYIRTNPPAQNKQYPNTNQIIHRIYSEHSENSLYNQFQARWNSLPCKQDSVRHLVFLWCGMMGVTTYYKNGKPTNWEGPSILDYWTSDRFLVDLDNLKNILNRHLLPLPDSLYSNATYSSNIAATRADWAIARFRPTASANLTKSDKATTESEIRLYDLLKNAGYKNSAILPMLENAKPIPEHQWDRINKLASERAIHFKKRPRSDAGRDAKEKALAELDRALEAAVGFQHASHKHPTNSNIQYIPYPKALRILSDNLNATCEELAAWIFFGPEDGGVAAYLNANELDPPPRFYFGGDSFDYISPLMACWFIATDIADFNPGDRFISGKALIKRWSIHDGIKPEAFIQAKIEESRLIDIHPICGATQQDPFEDEAPPPIESVLFSLSLIVNIESLDFPSRLTSGVDSEPKTSTEVGSTEWRKLNAQNAANVRHDKLGGSRDKQKKIREIWSTGKYTTRDICAEEEYQGLGMSFSTARKALVNTPNPKPIT